MNTLTPCAVYLQRLAASGRRSMAAQLKQVAIRLNWTQDVYECAFHTLNYAQIESIKIAMVGEGKSFNTINHLLSAIKCINREAFIMGLINEQAYSKIQAIKRVSGTKRKFEPPPQAEVKKLLSAIALETDPIAIRNAAIFAVLCGAGLRRSEVSNLLVEHFSSEQATLLVVKGKGNKDRQQPLADWVVNAINKWLLVRSNAKGYLFFGMGNQITPHQGLSPNTIYWTVRKYTKTILDTLYAPHDFRRVYITQLLKQNVDLVTVCKLAGHASVATTQVYDYRDSEVARVAAQNLSFGELDND